jgi:hypothetical protein
MAHPTASLPLRGTSVPSLAGPIERAILRFVTARAERARDLVAQYDVVAERMTRTLQRRRIPAHPTLGWFLQAQASIWTTTEELDAHSDRILADIQIPRELVKAIAILAAYGWPRQEATGSVETVAAGVPGRPFAALRRRFFPTDAELEEAYLSGSTDMNDLEYRMREWDRRLSRANGSAHYAA